MSTFGLIGLFLIGGSTVASAQCKLGLSDYAADDFVKYPRRLLARYPSGGQDLSFSIRGFASFNWATLLSIKSIIPAATPLQKQAIGEGLAFAVTECLPRDGETAKQIADVVRFASDRMLMQGYMRSASDDDPPAKAKAEPERRPSDWVQDRVIKAPSLQQR